MAGSLKDKTASALTWTTLDKFGLQFFNFVIGIILARNFLSPDEYGLMGMIGILTVLTHVLLDSGFCSALIRKKTVTQEEISTVFHFNLSISILCYLIIFFCAPFIASFFGYPILTNICRINSVAFILNSFVFTQVVSFSREANFKPIAISNLTGTVCAGIVAVIMAWQGFGVYALVFQNLVMNFVKGSSLWFFSYWRPVFVFNFHVIKSLWGYSSKLLFTGILNGVFNHISPILIGVYYPARDVGLYNQATKMSDLASTTVASSLQTATFPILSRIKEEQERLKKSYRKIIRLTSFISFPIMFGLSAIAVPFIHVLLKEQWHDSAIYMQILCVGAAFVALANLHINVLNVKGKSNLTLLFEIMRKALILIAIFLTFRYGIRFLAIGITIGNVLGFFISSFLMRKEVHYKISEQLKDIFPYLLIASVTAGGVYSLSFVINNQLILLITQLVSGIVFYLGTVYISGSKILREIIVLIRNNFT